MSGKTPLSAKQIVAITGALAGIAGCIADILGTFILGAHLEGYSSLTSPMSQLGVASDPVATEIKACWIAMGLSLTFFGATFGIAFPKQKIYATIAGVFLMLYGIGEGLGSAMFPADKEGAIHTTSGVLHGIVGGIGVTALILFPLLMAKIQPGLKSLYKTTFYIGLAFVILFGISRLVAPDVSKIAVFKGLWQRIYMLVYYLDIIIAACTILNDQRTRPARM